MVFVIRYRVCYGTPTHQGRRPLPHAGPPTEWGLLTSLTPLVCLRPASATLRRCPPSKLHSFAANLTGVPMAHRGRSISPQRFRLLSFVDAVKKRFPRTPTSSARSPLPIHRNLERQRVTVPPLRLVDYLHYLLGPAEILQAKSAIIPANTPSNVSLLLPPQDLYRARRKLRSVKPTTLFKCVE